MKHLKDPNVQTICIYGNEGVGKTCFINEFIRYVSIFAIIKDKMIHLNVSKSTKIEVLINQLNEKITIKD